jgi:hypothetical protein
MKYQDEREIQILKFRQKFLESEEVQFFHNLHVKIISPWSDVESIGSLISGLQKLELDGQNDELEGDAIERDKSNENADDDWSYDTSTKIEATMFFPVYRMGGKRDWEGSYDEFVDELRKCHCGTEKYEDEIDLICPSVFNDKLSETTGRCGDNVKYATGIWLENVGGDLPYHEFRELSIPE